MNTTTPTPPTFMSRMRKWTLPGLLVAGGAAFGMSQMGVEPKPAEPVVVMQDYIAGTEAFTSGHVYKVIQTNNMNGRECAIAPSAADDVHFWGINLRDQMHQPVPSTRQSFMAIPSAGTDLSSPLPWKMFKGASTLPAGPIDQAVCSATFDGGMGTSYVKVDLTPAPAPTDATQPQPPPIIKLTVVAPPGWPSKTITAAPTTPAQAAPPPAAASGGNATTNAVVTDAPKT